MNRSEHLLVCLAEECSEVIKAATKALRFGLQDGYPDTDRTNAKDIHDELAQVYAVAQMIKELGTVAANPEWHLIVEAKKQRVRQYMDYAVSKGTLKL